MPSLALIWRIVKYILNVAGLLWMLYAGMIAYGLIVQLPDCDGVMRTIRSVSQDLLLLYGLYLLVLTGLNLVVERWLEKRGEAREYRLLFAMSLMLLIAWHLYVSYHFYLLCCRQL